MKQVLRSYSIDVAAREKDDVNEDPIIVRLRKVRLTVLLLTAQSDTLVKAGGASYDGV